MTTTATDKTNVVADYPGFPSTTVTCKLITSVAINSASEIIGIKTYDITLDTNGEGSTELPTPDSTGTLAWEWECHAPDGAIEDFSLGYNANDQELGVLLAAAVSSTTPSDVATLITNKQSKDADAVSGNAAMMNDDGEAVDAGTAFTDLETTTGSQAKADAAEAASVPKLANIIAVSSGRDLQASDSAAILELNGTFTINFPDGLDDGFQVALSNVGSGTITITATTTLQSKDSAVTMPNRYGMATAYHRGSNVWLLAGDIA